MDAVQPGDQAAPQSLFLRLAPIMTAVFVAFLVIGLALPTLPLHVSRDLGLGAFMVGLVAGALAGGAVADAFGMEVAIFVVAVLTGASGVVVWLTPWPRAAARVAPKLG